MTCLQRHNSSEALRGPPRDPRTPLRAFPSVPLLARGSPGPRPLPVWLTAQGPEGSVPENGRGEERRRSPRRWETNAPALKVSGGLASKRWSLQILRKTIGNSPNSAQAAMPCGSVGEPLSRRRSPRTQLTAERNIRQAPALQQAKSPPVPPLCPLLGAQGDRST